jgi:hypothetical protein
MKIGGFLIIAAVALGACSGDPQPREPDPSATPTSTATPPPMPEQATEDSPEGAAAFVDYWVDVLNYAAISADVEPLRAISDAQCHSCQSLIDSLASPPSSEAPQLPAWEIMSVEPSITEVTATIAVLEEDGRSQYTLRFQLATSPPRRLSDLRRAESA